MVVLWWSFFWFFSLVFVWFLLVVFVVVVVVVVCSASAVFRRGSPGVSGFRSGPWVPWGFPVSGPARGSFCLGLRAACKETRLRSLVGASFERSGAQHLLPSGAQHLSLEDQFENSKPVAAMVRPPAPSSLPWLCVFVRRVCQRRGAVLRFGILRPVGGNSVWHHVFGLSGEILCGTSAAAQSRFERHGAVCFGNSVRHRPHGRRDFFRFWHCLLRNSVWRRGPGSKRAGSKRAVGSLRHPLPFCSSVFVKLFALLWCLAPVSCVVLR